MSEELVNLLLDVSRLPRNPMYGEGDTAVDLSAVVRRAKMGVDVWAELGIVKRYESFGFAAAHAGMEDKWDDPYAFVWFVYGFGPDGDRYIANAVRKLRPALRTRRDTLDLRLNAPELFQDKVESAEGDGAFKWGDFPWGGATYVKVGNFVVPCSVSCLKEVEDDAAAKAIGGMVGATTYKIDDPEEFA